MLKGAPQPPARNVASNRIAHTTTVEGAPDFNPRQLEDFIPSDIIADAKPAVTTCQLAAIPSGVLTSVLSTDDDFRVCAVPSFEGNAEMIRSYKGTMPQIAETAFIAESAEII